MLVLPIKRKWFDMILEGVKAEEYKNVNTYYAKRFMSAFNATENSVDEFILAVKSGKYLFNRQEVLFKNGYFDNSPSFVAEITLCIDTGNPDWGAVKGEEYFKIQIRDIHSLKNIKLNYMAV